LLRRYAPRNDIQGVERPRESVTHPDLTGGAMVDRGLSRQRNVEKMDQRLTMLKSFLTVPPA
jgi:hypothetical protein